MLIAVHLIFFYGSGVSHLEVSSSGALDMHHHATRMILFLIVYERFPLIAKCVFIIAALNHHSLSRVTDLTCRARVLCCWFEVYGFAALDSNLRQPKSATEVNPIHEGRRVRDVRRLVLLTS
jgi:hypothetical protein